MQRPGCAVERFHLTRRLDASRLGSSDVISLSVDSDFRSTHPTLLPRLAHLHKVFCPNLSLLSWSYCTNERLLTPFTDLTDPATLHNLLRLVMIIATYLLFRPYLSQFFRHISGAPDTREEQMKARVAAMIEEQEKAKKKS